MRVILYENFIYVCDERLGIFLKKYRPDFDFIIRTLKMGHCDILSWAMVAYLRQLGIPALVSSMDLPSPQGTSFLKASHAQALVITEDGSLLPFEATQVKRCPVGYRLENISDEEFEKLDSAYQAAQDERSKGRILQHLRDRGLQRLDCNPMTPCIQALTTQSSVVIAGFMEQEDPAAFLSQGDLDALPWTLQLSTPFQVANQVSGPEERESIMNEYSRFLAMMSEAWSTPRARRYLQERWGINQRDLIELAYLIHPHMRPGLPLRTTVPWLPQKPPSIKSIRKDDDASWNREVSMNIKLLLKRLQAMNMTPFQDESDPYKTTVKYYDYLARSPISIVSLPSKGGANTT